MDLVSGTALIKLADLCGQMMIHQFLGNRLVDLKILLFEKRSPTGKDLREVLCKLVRTTVLLRSGLTVLGTIFVWFLVLCK